MWKVASPNKKICLIVDLNSKKELTYSICLNDIQIITPSSIGLVTNIGNFGINPAFIRKKHSMINEQYSLPAGKKSTYVNCANIMSLYFKQNNYNFILDTRVFNDGVAFRYRINGKSIPISIINENTIFNFSQKFQDMWLQDWVNTYEGPYNHIGWNNVENKHFGMPCLFHAKKEGCWVLLTEAGILNAGGNYCSCHVLGLGPNTMRLAFAPEQTNPIQTAFPFATPWRVVVLTENLNGLINTTINCNLNPKSKLKDTSWIKPARSIWSWWSFENGAQLYSEQKRYVDFAAAMGFESITVDAGWDKTWIKDLCAYATERGVSVWLWSDMQALDTFEKASEKILLWASWGVAGLKVDFFMNDSQHTMWQYNMIADLMTQNKLMINFHGSTKPAGESRTWPNLMTEEAIMGLEHYKWSDMPNAVHNCTVPFTRNVVGPMDYTVTGISNLNRNTTHGHQLAMSIVYESGIQHFADSIYTYEPWIGIEFLRRTYAHYDEVELLEGYPGDYVVMMRRKGNEWFIGAMVTSPRTITVDLNFLPKGNYKALLFKDGDAGDILVREPLNLKGRNSITIKTLENGGFTCYISNGSIPLRSGLRQGYMESHLKCFFPQQSNLHNGATFVQCANNRKGKVVKLCNNARVDFNTVISKSERRKTLRLYYSAQDISKMDIIVNGKAERITLVPSGSIHTFRTENLIIYLTKGQNSISILQKGENIIFLDHIKIIESAPNPETFYSADLAVIEGSAKLLPVPNKETEKSIQGIGPNGAAIFPQVWAEDDGKYILILDYYSAENRYLQVFVNDRAPVTTILFNSGGWGKTRWDIMARKELMISLRKGFNTIRLEGYDTDGPHIGRIGIRLETINKTSV